MERFAVNVETAKPSPLDDLLAILRKILDWCLCCVTCGCYHGNNAGERLKNGEFYEVELLESERHAIGNLLQYLDSEMGAEATINGERLRALSILTFSDNVDLQRSASLCYAEISAKMKVPLTDAMVEPLIVLLKSRDVKVQKATTLAVSNFILHGADSNKDTIVRAGAMGPLVRLLASSDIEVQCNTCGCITTLATSEPHQQLILSEDGVTPLLDLVKSSDRRVQRNAAGAILNLTHSQSHRGTLVVNGAIPVLVDTLRSRDSDVQFYCIAALSNIAVDERHRMMMTAVGHQDVIKNMTKLLSSGTEKVKCQVCLALRNLASDGDNQLLIVKQGALSALQTILRRTNGETLAAAVACLRNLSIHKGNECAVIQAGLVRELCRIVQENSNPEAQRHAAGTLRNLAVGEQVGVLLEQGVLDCLVCVLLEQEPLHQAVLMEVTAALAVLADQDIVKQQLVVMYQRRVFTRLVAMASLSTNSEVQYNAAGILGQISLSEIPDVLKKENCEGIIVYVDKFLKSAQPNFIHIALWTLVQLLKDEYFVEAFRDVHMDQVVKQLSSSPHPSAILDLCDAVLNDLLSDSTTEEGNESSESDQSHSGGESHIGSPESDNGPERIS